MTQIQSGRTSRALGSRDPRARHRSQVNEPTGVLQRDTAGQWSIKPMQALPNTSATTVSALVAHVNQLQQILRNHGLMEG